MAITGRKANDYFPLGARRPGASFSRLHSDLAISRATRLLFRWWGRSWFYKQFRTGLVNALHYGWQVPKSLPIFFVSQTGVAPVLGLIFLPIKVNRSPTLTPVVLPERT